MCSMFWAGLEEAAVTHIAIGQVGTLELWLDMLLHLFAALNTHHALSSPWQDTIPDLRGTQLQTV